MIPLIPLPLHVRAATWLLGKAWHIGSILGVVASVYLGFQLMSVKSDLRSAKQSNADLTTRNTQLSRDLAQAQTNVGTMQTALNDQNAQLRSLSAASQAKLDALGKGVDAANRASVVTDRRVRDFLTFSPKGADVCARVLQIDTAFVERLLREDDKVTGQ